MVAVMPRSDPLAWNVPIVGPDGRPTAEFMLKWNEQNAINGDIPAFNTPAEVSALLDVLGATRGSLLVRTVTGWVILPPGALGKVLASHGPGADPAWESLPGIQDYLDSISDDQGTVLYRGASVWSALAPGTSGYVLQTNGPGADPSWVAQSGGGGGGNSPFYTPSGNNTAFSPTTGTSATKGHAITPLVDAAIDRVVWQFDSAFTNGAQLRGFVADAPTNAVGSILGTTNTLTWSTGDPLFFELEFATPVDLSAGTRYLVGLSWINAPAGTSVLKAYTATNYTPPGFIGIPSSVVSGSFGLVQVQSAGPSPGAAFTATPSSTFYSFNIRAQLK